MNDAPEIHCWRQGRLGRISLNRARSLNALTLGMVEAIGGALSDWDRTADVVAVVIEGAGPRGLCAGGDIRGLYEAVRRGEPGEADRFLHAEYRLNAQIAQFAKPYLALMDGLVMGGGVGISAHGTMRIVTERTRLAMPEVNIGFVPDIGGTYLLSHAPGEFGTHMALTAEPIGAADAILCGLADHHLPSGSLPRLIDVLATCGDGDAVAACVAAHATPSAPGMLAEAAWIGECYRHDDVAEIVAALAAHPHPDARAAAARIGRNCPTSLVVALRALRQARIHGSLLPCLEQEYRLATGLIRRADFLEGVRAAVVDKDRNPAWHPATLSEVDPAEIETLFASTASLGLLRGSNAAKRAP